MTALINAVGNVQLEVTVDGVQPTPATFPTSGTFNSTKQPQFCKCAQNYANSRRTLHQKPPQLMRLIIYAMHTIMHRQPFAARQLQINLETLQIQLIYSHSYLRMVMLLQAKASLGC